MQTIETVLESNDEIAIIEAVGTHIWAKKQTGDLNHFELTFVYVDIFEAAMNEGGLHYFFNTESGDFAKEIIQAYKDINATKTATLLTKAFQLFTVKYTSNTEDRKKVIEKMDEKSISGWEDLDELFFSEEEEDVVNLIVDYIRNNKSKFMN
ncbi:DMP19 family protein [Flavobacterium difficile]|uniref:DMP19 family protein n=1 Tax=Flavobacterium difficile TaxID=2709659 RepID=A0ABX0I1X4_9FLAO|nr:DUF4375 domain-containing protein [Flavobacterium difficile]NHM01191.1 DMP19 family protein [Flavobacterium difficile]